MNRMKIFYTLGVLAISTAFLMLCYVWFMMLYPFNILTDTKMEVTTPVVRSGEDIEVLISFDKNYNFDPSEINYFLVNGFVYKLPYDSIQRPIGEQVVRRVFTIPAELDAGTYYLQVETAYSVFPLREDIQYTWKSNTFQVIE